ncbi:MAG: molybdopterin molybdotransferase MoeA, partial [Planctomycetales bacterium]|nr:molybdopterin molybdotransferase MoeA [Planctomycetales bacterium]
MISVEEALTCIARATRPLPIVELPITAAVGRTLAEDVASDIDSPPHDKSMVDGYAVLASDLAAGPVELRVLEEVTAGQVPTQEVVAGTATRIMTGAPIPAGADAVVMVERTRQVAETRSDLGGSPSARVAIDDARLRAGTNILPRATSLARGEVVLRAGHRLRGIEVGLLAEVGRATVRVHRQPRVAVLATGNELVPVGQTVPAGSIRNSNGPMLATRIEQLGAEAIDLGIGRDEPRQLAELIQRGLAADVLLLSGGVSAGVLDLVPQVLADAGVVREFHKVNLKPGKPLWFGVYADGSESGDRVCLVFGLPGNPVSSLVCFELFVRPALAAMQSARDTDREFEDASVPGQLATGFHHRGDRVTFHPAQTEWANGVWRVHPLAWHGSADLKTLT